MSTQLSSQDDDSDPDKVIFDRLIQSVKIMADMWRVNELFTSTQHSKFTMEHISKLFGVSINKAEDILFTTTQKGVHTAMQPWIDHLHLHVNNCHGTWTLDHMELKVKSIDKWAHWCFCHHKRESCCCLPHGNKRRNTCRRCPKEVHWWHWGPDAT